MRHFGPCDLHDGRKLHWRETASVSNSFAKIDTVIPNQRPFIFRNVARTRFRDSTRRAQKNHFGRRRLGILSRDLVSGARSRTEKPKCGMSGIQLEHAQRDISISRLLHPSPTRETGAVGAFASASDGSSAAVSSSGIGSTLIPSNSRITQILDDGSCEYPAAFSFQLRGTSFQRLFPTNRDGSCSRIFKDSRPLQLHDLPQARCSGVADVLPGL